MMRRMVPLSLYLLEILCRDKWHLGERDGVPGGVVVLLAFASRLDFQHRADFEVASVDIRHADPVSKCGTHGPTRDDPHHLSLLIFFFFFFVTITILFSEWREQP